MMQVRARGRARIGIRFALLLAVGSSGGAGCESRSSGAQAAPSDCTLYSVRPTTTPEAYVDLGRDVAVPSSTDFRTVPIGRAGSGGRIPTIRIAELPTARAMTVTLLSYHEKDPPCVVSTTRRVALQSGHRTTEALPLTFDECGAEFFALHALAGRHPGRFYRMAGEVHVIRVADIGVIEELDQIFHADDLTQLQQSLPETMLSRMDAEDPSFPYVVFQYSTPNQPLRHIIRHKNGALAWLSRSSNVLGIILHGSQAYALTDPAPGGCLRVPLGKAL